LFRHKLHSQISKPDFLSGWYQKNRSIIPMRYLLFFALIMTAVAQDSGKNAREVYLRLLAFDHTTLPPETFFFDLAAPQPQPGLKAEIKGYLNHEGMKLQIFGNELLFSKSSKTEDAGKSELQVAKVNIPKSGNRFILVFLPGQDQTYRVLPLDDSIKEFPLGSYRVISLSRFPVKLTLEGKSYEFKPGQSSLITDPPVQANNHSAMYAFTEINGKWERIGSNLWPHPGRKREVQIFFDNPASRTTELRGFKDISPPVPNAAPATP
jgi:hypothetical protein